MSQVHFHWGSNDEQGSEHLVGMDAIDHQNKSADDIDFYRKLLIQVDGKAFPLEMHLVHYKVIVKHVAAVAVDNSTV